MTEIRKLNDTTSEILLPNGETIEVSDDSTLKLNRWTKERSVSLWLPGFTGSSVVEAGKMIISSPMMRLELFGDENNAAEYKITLLSRPPTNEISLGIDTLGLDFFRQPPLTEELKVGKYYSKVTETAAFDKNGIEVTTRPEKVIEALVFKHNTRSQHFWNNHADARKYRTGIFGTLFRPYEETHGVWCGQRIEGDRLIITIPYDLWLNAVYPLIIDPTFGGTPAPNSLTTLENQIEGCGYICPEAGTGDSITAYVDYSTSYHDKAALYDGTLLVTNGACTEGVHDTDGENTWNFASSPTLANQEYIPVAWSESISGTCKIGYDTGSHTRYRKAQTYNGFPADLSSWTSTYSNIDTYIFVTYTAGGGPTNYPINSSCDLALTSTPSYVLAAARSFSVNIDLAASASKALATIRASTSNISLGASATGIFGKVISAISNLSAAASASRALAGFRAAASALSLAAAASRIIAAARSSSSNLSLGASATSTIGAIISAVANLSLAASSSITVAWGRTASAALGLAASSSITVAWGRTASAALGLAASAIATLVEWVSNVVSLNLVSRSQALTLKDRGADIGFPYTFPIIFGGSVPLALQSRSTSLTLQSRSISLTLQTRSTSLTLRDRNTEEA